MMDDLVGALHEAWKAAGLSYLSPVCDANCHCQNVCSDDEQSMLKI